MTDTQVEAEVEAEVEVEVEVEVQKLEVDESVGLRRSERTRGRKVCYNHTVILPSCDEMPPKKKRTKKQLSKESNSPPTAVPVVAEEMVQSLLEEPSEELCGLTGLGFLLGKSHTGNSPEKSDNLKVKETLRVFNNCYLHFVQVEANRCKKDVASKTISDGNEKSTSRRPDLKAMNWMRINGKYLYQKKQLGAFPGVDVGYQFFSRCEMVVVGFHNQCITGIDYMGKDYRQGELQKYDFPLAVAVVMSGKYEDDVDKSEDVIYTGQGGNDHLGNKKQVQDQKMEGGNLALKNSALQHTPVRVIRGHRSKSSYVGTIYTYDGLYEVVEYWAEKGISGYNVYKFRMKRLKGQPQLTTTQVQFIRGQVPDTIADKRGLVCEDISKDQEKFPIPATNLVDDAPMPDFIYSKSLQVPDNLKIPAPTTGCGCKGSCNDPRICACAWLNGSDFPYVDDRGGGRLKEARALVFECGKKCGCGPACINRTSQRELRFRFEVFRTSKKGWGVRSWDYIPAGAPICEYTGKLKKSDEAERTLDDTYLFDIDCLQTMEGLDGRQPRQMRLRDVSVSSKVLFEKETILDSGPEYCIDASSTGNFSRFINHSCDPNLFIQCVLSSHHDIKLAKVMLFASDNIPPLQELTYDYGYALDSVLGPDGKVKQVPCYCDAADCRKRLM